jgi:hypothetical protein
VSGLLAAFAPRSEQESLLALILAVIVALGGVAAGLAVL